jgi:hypothetical protein
VFKTALGMALRSAVVRARFNCSSCAWPFLLAGFGPNFGPKLRNTGRNAVILDALVILNATKAFSF